MLFQKFQRSFIFFGLTAGLVFFDVYAMSQSHSSDDAAVAHSITKRRRSGLRKKPTVVADVFSDELEPLVVNVNRASEKDLPVLVKSLIALYKVLFKRDVAWTDQLITVDDGNRLRITIALPGKELLCEVSAGLLPIHFLAYDSSVELLQQYRALHKETFGATKNIPDVWGNTSLLAACVNGNFDVAKILLQSGNIDLEVKNCDGKGVAKILLDRLERYWHERDNRIAYESCYALLKAVTYAFMQTMDEDIKIRERLEAFLLDLEVSYFNEWPAVGGFIKFGGYLF